MVGLVGKKRSIGVTPIPAFCFEDNANCIALVLGDTDRVTVRASKMFPYTTVLESGIGNIKNFTVGMVQCEVVDITFIVVTVKVESQLPFFQFSLLQYGNRCNKPHCAQEPEKEKAFHAIYLLRSSVCSSTL